jgi:hypothetical protein
MRLGRRAERAKQCFIASARDFFVAIKVGIFIRFRTAHNGEYHGQAAQAKGRIAAIYVA